MTSIKYYLVIILTIKVMHTHFRKFGKDRKVKKKKKLIIYKILPKNNPVTVFCYISFQSFYLHIDIFIYI